MRNILIVFLLLFSNLAYADMLPQISRLDRAVSIQEEDGDPTVYDVRRVKYPNNTVIDNNDGTVSIITSAQLNYFIGSQTLDKTLTDSEAALQETPTSTPETLSTITFKSIVVETPTPFTIEAGTLIFVHFDANVTTISSVKDTQLSFELYYMDADGSGNQQQIGTASELTTVLTATQAAFTNHIHVATETLIPTGKRLWLKVIATSAATPVNFAEINFYYDDSAHHLTFGVAGSIVENFVKRDGTTPMTADWDIGNYNITLKDLNSDGIVTITNGDPADPYSAIEVLSGANDEYTAYGLGSDAIYHHWAVVGGGDDYVTGTTQYDAVLSHADATDFHIVRFGTRIDATFNGTGDTELFGALDCGELTALGTTHTLYRNTAVTDAAQNVMSVGLRTSGNMADGFGPNLLFGIADDADGAGSFHQNAAFFCPRVQGSDFRQSFEIQCRTSAGMVSGLQVIPTSGAATADVNVTNDLTVDNDLSVTGAIGSGAITATGTIAGQGYINAGIADNTLGTIQLFADSAYNTGLLRWNVAPNYDTVVAFWDMVGVYQSEDFQFRAAGGSGGTRQVYTVDGTTLAFNILNDLTVNGSITGYGYNPIDFSISNPYLLYHAGRGTNSTILWQNDVGKDLTINKIRAIADTDNYNFTLYKSANLTDINVTNDVPLDVVLCSANGDGGYYANITTGFDNATIESGRYLIFEHNAVNATSVQVHINASW